MTGAPVGGLRLTMAMVSGAIVTCVALNGCGATAGEQSPSPTAPTGSAPEQVSPTSAAPPAPAAATVTVTPTVVVTVTNAATVPPETPSAPALPSPPQDDIGTIAFWLDSRGAPATLTARTRNADGTVTITGVIDEQGADEYCQRYEQAAGAELQACIAKVVAEQGTFVHEATADCLSGTLTTNGPGGGTFTPLGDDTWQDVNSGQVRNSSSAGGGGTLTLQYELACRGQ